MKTTVRMLSLALGLLLTASVAASAAVNLSGTWVLDRSQSQFPSHGDTKGGATGGQTQTPPEVKLIVQQQGDTLKLTRTMSRNGKERTFTETITTNGTEQTDTHRHGTTVSKATWNGDQLVVTETSNMTTSKGEVQTSRHSVWSVSPDGRTLTIETTLNGPRGERSMKTVYVKS